jgi:hypothetical protein
MPKVLPRTVARGGKYQGINVAHSLLALIARLSLLRGHELSPGHLTDDAFLRLLRTGCELWDPADDATDPEYILRVMYEQAPYQDDAWQALPRAKLMYVDACRALGDPEIDIGVEFQERFGLSIESFITIGFALFAQLFTDPVFYPLVHWHSSVPGIREVLTKDNVNTFLNIVAADQQRFRDEDARRRPTGVDEGRYDFNPLFKYPVIDLGGGKCMAPLPNLVAWRLYTAPFYELADAFMEEGHKNRFRSFFGHVFQSYVGLLLRDVLPHEDVLPEVGGDSVGPVDWVARIGIHALLVECRARDLTLPAKSTGDLALIESDLEKIAVDTIRKLPRKIKFLQEHADDYGLQDIDSWHALVVLKEPLLPVTRVRELINGKLGEPADYHLLSTGDFEQLMALHDAVGVQQVLSDKAAADEIGKDFRTFFHERRDKYAFRRNPLLNRISDEFFAQFGIDPDQRGQS